MGFLETQNLTARLFSDERLRRSFLENAEKIGAKNGLTAQEVTILKQTVNKDFEFFAESLFYKRLQEVEKLLPLTRKIFEKKEFENRFREFSQDFQPQSIKKHFEDAIKFVEFLTKQKVEFLWIQDLAKFEQGRLVFNGYEKTFVYRQFNHSIYEILRIAEADSDKLDAMPKTKKSFAVWYRIGKKARHFYW